MTSRHQKIKAKLIKKDHIQVLLKRPPQTTSHDRRVWLNAVWFCWWTGQVQRTRVAFPTRHCWFNTETLSDPRERAARMRLRWIRVCSGRSQSRWSSRYTDTRAWRSAEASARGRLVRRTGTAARAHECLRSRPRTVRARCSRRTGHFPDLTKTGSTARSWDPLESRTCVGTGRARARAHNRKEELHKLSTSP